MGTYKSLAKGRRAWRRGEGSTVLLPQYALGPLGNSVLLLHKGQAASSREGVDIRGLGFWQMAHCSEELSLATGRELCRNPANRVSGSPLLGNPALRLKTLIWETWFWAGKQLRLGQGVTSVCLPLPWVGVGGALSRDPSVDGCRWALWLWLVAITAPAAALLGLRWRQCFFTGQKIFSSLKSKFLPAVYWTADFFLSFKIKDNLF